ncbi:MAG: Mur ligase family protein [Planctomycetota bacterium]
MSNLDFSELGPCDDSSSSSSVRLADLFPEATRTGTEDVVFSSCVCDWREVQPGDVYVALPDTAGDEGDGHLHAQRAVSCGAIAVVCEQPVPVFDVPTYLVPDTRVALGEISHALMGHPSRSLEVIGVAGTHGKSTTIALLEAIFSAAGRHCGVLSSLGSYDGMTHSAGISDLPSSPAIACRLARMEAAGCTHAFVEVSSQSLSQARWTGVELDAICITNVTSAHLDLHNTVKGYRDTERRVMSQLSPSGLVALNADDPVSMSWLDQVSGPVLTYGLGGAAEVTARLVESHANGQTFILTAGSDSVAVNTSMVGEHQIANCLAAATVALSYGIELTQIATGLESVEKLSARMELVDCGQGFPLYVDAADTVDSLRASLRTAHQLAQGRVVCVWTDSGHASVAERLAVSQVLSRMADLAIVSQPLVRYLDDDQHHADVEVVADRSEAIACAIGIAEPGDVVVIAGSRVRPSYQFGGEADFDTDAEIARQMLYAREVPALRLVS